MSKNSPKRCESCGSAMIKKQSGHATYHECQHCGKKENENV